MSGRAMIRGLVFAAISVLDCASAARAASFDCAKAASRIERLICGDVDLDSFDSQLEGAYAGALDRSAHPDRLKGEQRAWLKARDACADVKCLSATYQKRITDLSQVSDEPAACAGSTTPEVNACGAEYAGRADRELARYQAAVRERLAAEAKDDPSNTKTTLAAFEASQKAWEAFRKAECDAVYDWWSGGTIRGAMYEGCLRSETKARTEQIWRVWLSFEDSTPPLMPKPSEK